MIDFVHIVIGGADPETVLDEDVRRTADAYDRLNTTDIMQPTFFAETAGLKTRTLGAALMPIAKSFLLETTEFDLQTRLLSKWKSEFEVAGVMLNLLYKYS